MAHAHPSPNRFIYNDENNQTVLRPRPLFHHANPTPPSPIDPARDRSTPLGLQNRRLQLRNINFRGTILPSRRLSTHISKWTAGTLQTDKSEQKESRAGTTRRRPTDADESSPPPPSGSILQEINNSSRRIRLSPPRPSIASIFEDSDSPSDPLEDSSTSWYQETSNNSTPQAFARQEDDPYAMKSPPPLSSPLVKQVRGRKKSRMNLRSASYEQSKYIEHLESQLAIAESKNESPSVRGPVGKLRTMTAENNCLKQELADWEEKFNERVDDAVRKKVEMESSMRGQIRSLEQEVESKDRRIKEMEWELERASVRLSDMDSLEATNRSLERRLDVLTELLAHSPTRPQHPLERTSPFRLKTPRPKSIMPILPSSEAVALSRCQSTTYAASSAKISLSEANSPTLRFASGEIRTDFVPHKKMLSEGMGSVDSGLGESCSMGSGQTFGSRPVSFMSDSSNSPSAWGLPLPGMASPEMISRQGTRNRKMRKFPSGSASLKPLILPTTSAAMVVPPSASVFSPQTSPSRDVSGASIDPTTSFLSKHSYDSLFDTPTQQRVRSSTWVEEDTLRILEGNRYDPLGQMESLDSALSSQDITCFDANTSHSLTDSLERHLENDYASSPPAEVQEPSFEAEIEGYLCERRLREAEARSMNRFSILEEAIEDSTTESNPSVSDVLEIEEDATNSDLASFTEFATITTPPKIPESNNSRRRDASSDINSTPVPSHPQKTCQIPQPPPAKCSPLVSLVPTTVLGSISRYTSYFKEVRRDPTALARRLIANAWCANWSRFGRLSWWVLGLFLGSSGRDGLCNKPAVDDDFDWHYYSADASKARRVGSLETDLPDGSRLGLTSNGGQSARPASPKRVTFNDGALERRRCNECVESSFGRSIRLWAKFSFALVLAVGVAVKDGPGSLLTETNHCGSPKETEASRSPPPSVLHMYRRDSPDRFEAIGGRSDSWSGKLTWIQNLGVGDFVKDQR